MRAVVILLGVAGTVVGAQVFRSTTQHVSVSVIVTDRAGRPVTGLTRNDFELTTNGRPQTIADFSAVSIPPGNRDVDLDAPTKPPSDVVANAVAVESSRAFVFVIHDASIPASELVPLKRMMTAVLRTLTPQDQVALIYTGRSDLSQDFTSDIDRLIDAVNNRREAANGFHMQVYRSLMITLRSVVASLSTSRHARRAVFLVGTRGCSLDPIADEWQYCHDLVEAAKRADVPFYVLNPRLFTDSSAAMSITSPEARAGAARADRDDRDSMMTLAAATGGRAMSGAADPPAAAAEIVLENSNYYLLGFYPEPIVNDGKFHEIKVAVKRPDLIVRARAGYMAADASPPKPMTATRAMTGELGAGLDDPGLAIRAFAAPLSPAPKGRTRTLITVEVTYPYEQNGSRAINDDVRVGILALTPDAKIKASFQRPIKLTGTWRPNAQGKLIINETIDLPTEQLALRIGVTSRALGKSGTTHMAIEPPDFEDKNIQLGGLVIAAGAVDADAAMGLDSLRGVVPFQPTTSRTFANTDTLRLYAPISWGGDGDSATVQISIKGGEGSPPRTVNVPGRNVTRGHRTGGLDTTIPLASLSPGDYVLRVEASLNRKSAVREVPFFIK